jgi:hypothetical protein
MTTQTLTNPSELSEYKFYANEPNDETFIKLMQMKNRTNDLDLKNAIYRLMSQYVDGNVAIAWNKNKPVWYNVSHSSKKSSSFSLNNQH